MFQLHKKLQGNAAVKRSVQKILDPKKDIVTRLKHLRLVLENVADPAEEQTIFDQYYSHIYYVFFENFLIAEANLRQKGAHRAQREELDGMLQIFETILVRLPDMLHERWQYNSIDRIIKTLLHPGNSLKMRRDGVKFFLLWFRALRENAKEETILLYASFVPGFPTPQTNDERYTSCTVESLLNPPSESQSGMFPAEIACLVPPPAGEKNPPDLTKFFLDTMLEFMVVEACKLEWKDRQSANRLSFSFLWDMFKKFYLPHIFQDFRFDTSVYQPDLALPEPREPVNYILNVTETGSIDPCIEVGEGCPMLPARVSTIKWVVVFTSNTLREEARSGSGRLADKSVTAQVSHLSVPGSSQEQEGSNSNASTLTEKAPSLSSLSSLDDKLKAVSSVSEEEQLVREVLYSTRENVNIVHEVFRQALMLPLTEAKTMRRVVKVYQEWIQDGMSPVFMDEPDVNVDDESEANNLVKAGCQTTFQLFITNSAHVFLVEPPNDAHKLIQAQVDVCKRVLNLYRHMVMHIVMDNTTWTQLLQVLLHITRIMLQDADSPPSIRVTSVAGRLAGPVFQTLIVSWIKANLFVHVSRELWDELVNVLSSLMHWKDLIVEWARNMDTMTRVLARHVYGLELSDLPLDRLTEQKQMKNRRGLREKFRQPERSFSRGWSRETVHAKSDLRLRSRTTFVNREDHEPDSKIPPSLMEHTMMEKNNNLQPLQSRGRSATVLGLEPSPETDPTLRNFSPPHEQAEHTGNLPLKRGLSDTSDFSTSPPPGLLTVKTDSLQRCSSTSDITSEKKEVFNDVEQSYYRQSSRQRSNSGPGYGDRDDMEETVHGLRIRSSIDDGVTSLSSVEDAFNDMFDELAQQRLSITNPKNELLEGQPDIVSVKSQDSGSIDPNWNPWAESNGVGVAASGVEDPEQFFLARSEKEIVGYSDLRDDDETEWGSCLEDSNYGEDENEDHSSMESDSSSTANEYDFSSTTGMLPPLLTELPLTSNQDENLSNDVVSMLSKDQNTSSEAASPGVPSPPYEIYKHDSRDRYDSTALLIPDARRSNSQLGNRESIAEGDETARDSPDTEAILEKSSDDILGVHYNNPRMALISSGSTGMSDQDEDTTGQQNKTVDSLLNSDDCSILAGGRRTGWYPDVAVALWRRLMGILGDVNKVEDPVIHQLIFTYLLKFWDVLFKLRDNLGITTDNTSTPPPPELVPPLRIMAPWAFKAVMSLPESHKGGILHAFQLLCNTTLQTHDTRLEPEHLALFYMVLHEGLHSDQDKVNEIVESSCPKVFSCSLPASTLLLLDFLYACHSVAASTDLSGPRVEAQTILGSVLCFPNLYYNLPVLNPDCKEPQIFVCSNIKEYVADALLTSAKKEKSAPARCVALSGLGVWLYEELTSPVEENYPTPSTENEEGFTCDTNLSPVKGRILARHGRVKEAINVLLVSLKFNNRGVASIACSQLHLLTHCIPQLLECMPETPCRIIEVMSLTASSLLQTSEAKSSDSGRRLLVSLLLCICDWCMLVPLPMLIEGTLPGSEKRLIRTVFKALQTGALGKPGHSAKHSYSLSDLASKDFDPNLKLDKVLENSSSGSGPPRNNTKLSLPPLTGISLGTDNVVSLTASTVLSHLTNHLGHFPLAKGPAVLNSVITEQQDHGPPVDKSLSADLSNNLFNSPNVQFLIYNDSCLLSMVEIPALKNVPGTGPTAGLPTAPTNVRLIIRDTGGKFCWDSSILYGTPEVKDQTEPVSVTPLSTMNQEIARVISEHCRLYISHAEAELQRKRTVIETPLPLHNASLDPGHANDKLDQLLQYIGYSSPECQEYPGRPLNIPGSAPKVIEDTGMQEKSRGFLLQQHESQGSSYSANIHHSSCQSRCARPRTYSPPQSPFHQSRLLISQTAFLSNENRRRVSLLKKNERLLRELKNLDSRSCRETHKVAVLYIAPGQEDKLSVLSNTAGSEEFENFVSGLGWEVDLKAHCGFRGKLHSDGSTGETSPYYATSTLEVVFHVSTRFPSTNDDSRNMKLKHLGNDEVHIVWSEHGRDYRRGIIPTEFGDVLIIIYPMKHKLYRIQIIKKEEIPYFGPLFDGAIVNARILPVLVRETAINAGRAKRSQISLYQPFYEERAKYLRQIIDQFRDDTTFEDYAAQLFSPAQVRASSSPVSKSGPKRPAPKPSPPAQPPVNESPPPHNTTVGSSMSPPTPIVGRILPLTTQQITTAANSNNNNSINENVHAAGGQNGVGKRRHCSEESYSSTQSLPPHVKDPPPIEKEAGPRYTPGHQISSVKAAANAPTPHNPLSSKGSAHFIPTPRPKPTSSHQTSISALSFSQQQLQPTFATPIQPPTKIHIPVSKMQLSATKSTSSVGHSSTPLKRPILGHKKATSAANAEVVLIAPPTVRTNQYGGAGKHSKSLSVPSSPIVRSTPAE